VIGQGLEKYLTIGWGKHIVFKDSLQFLLTSLANLVDMLDEKGAGREKFRVLKGEFRNATPEQLALLTQKGVFPYDYLTSAAKLQEDHLPPIEAFRSRLHDADCTPEDYARAQTVEPQLYLSSQFESA